MQRMYRDPEGIYHQQYDEEPKQFGWSPQARAAAIKKREEEAKHTLVAESASKGAAKPLVLKPAMGDVRTAHEGNWHSGKKVGAVVRSFKGMVAQYAARHGSGQTSEGHPTAEAALDALQKIHDTENGAVSKLMDSPYAKAGVVRPDGSSGITREQATDIVRGGSGEEKTAKDFKTKADHARHLLNQGHSVSEASKISGAHYSQVHGIHKTLQTAAWKPPTAKDISKHIAAKDPAKPARSPRIGHISQGRGMPD